jgi:hypothetical protein
VVEALFGIVLPGVENLIDFECALNPAFFEQIVAQETRRAIAAVDDPNRIDRITLWITNTARITHPTRYTVVQLQGVLHQEVAPGEAPPRPVVDPDEPVVSVIMVRDLGWVRLRPALVAIGSFLIFLTLCYWLHVRDKELMSRREEFETAKA